MGDRVRLEDIPEDLVEDVINSAGFQKMLAYRKLSDGIEVLEENDQLFRSMVSSITKQHSQVSSERTTKEFFELFVAEVQDYTEGLVDDALEARNEDPLDDLVVDDGE